MIVRTTAVIVNWNGADYLERLLNSLGTVPVEAIIVVDNASTDSSAEILSRYSGVQIIRNRNNVGFGAAANQGIALTKSPYVLLLNVDVEVLPGSIETLENFLEEHQEAAIAAPCLLFSDGKLQPSCRSFPTVSRLFLYFSYLDNVIPSRYRLSEKDLQRTREVEQPMGAAWMVRKSVFEEASGFDTSFFLYMEDVDFCRRIQSLGWKIYYLADARMIHHAGGSSRQDWERSQMNLFESILVYFKKHDRKGSTIWLRISLSMALVIRTLVFFLRGRIKQAVYYLKMSVKILLLEPS